MTISFFEEKSVAGVEFHAQEYSILEPVQASDVIEVLEWCEAAFGRMLIPTGRGPATKSLLWEYVLERAEKLVLQNGQLRAPLGSPPRHSLIVRLTDDALAQKFRERWACIK